MCCVLAISVASKVRHCAVPPDNFRGAISFSHTSNILNLIQYLHTYIHIYIYIYISHSPCNVGNTSLFVCLHGCAVACTSCATKQTFAQCRIFLEETLLAIRNASFVFLQVFFILLIVLLLTGPCWNTSASLRNKIPNDCMKASSQVMFALKVHSNRTHFNQQSLKQTAQVGQQTAKAVT